MSPSCVGLVAGTILALSFASSVALADVTMGPAVAPHGPGCVSVMWESSQTTPQTLTLRSPGRADQTLTSQLEGGVHHVDASGLAPGVEYSYAVEGRVGRFMSPPKAAQDVRFVVFGDTRTGDNVHRQLIAKMAELRPDFAMVTGDLVARGSDMAQWRNFFDIERPLLEIAPLSSSLGNHDVGSPLFSQLVRQSSATEGATPTYGSMDIGPAHFLMVDTEQSLVAGSAEYRFIERDLAANKARPIMVFLHKPLFSSGNHGGTPEVHDNLGPLFQRFGVDVVFQGHDHHYERTTAINGVTYVVTGGGGAPLYGVAPAAWTARSGSVNHFMLVEASGTRIRVTATQLDGTALDAFEIDPRANNGAFTGGEAMPTAGGGGAPFACSAVPGAFTRATTSAPALAGFAGAIVYALKRIRRRRALARARGRAS